LSRGTSKKAEAVGGGSFFDLFSTLPESTTLSLVSDHWAGESYENVGPSQGVSDASKVMQGGLRMRFFAVWARSALREVKAGVTTPVKSETSLLL